LSKQLRIYIAGKYTPQTKDVHTAAQEAAHNVHKAIVVAIALIEKGHLPFVPHLSHYIHIDPACNIDFGNTFYYEYDNSFLIHWAEALFYIEPSHGADNELKLAKELGLKIFYSLDEVTKVKKK